jgi:hypothetical protein
MVQLVPFQRSARSFEAVPPTAVQDETEVHETALKASPALLAVGVGWMRQFVPFQRSAIVPTGLPELSKPAIPTAVQVEAEVHETPPNPP